MSAGTITNIFFSRIKRRLVGCSARGAYSPFSWCQTANPWRSCANAVTTWSAGPHRYDAKIEYSLELRSWICGPEVCTSQFSTCWIKSPYRESQKVSQFRNCSRHKVYRTGSSVSKISGVRGFAPSPNLWWPDPFPPWSSWIIVLVACAADVAAWDKSMMRVTSSLAVQHSLHRSVKSLRRPSNLRASILIPISVSNHHSIFDCLYGGPGVY